VAWSEAAATRLSGSARLFLGVARPGRRSVPVNLTVSGYANTYYSVPRFRRPRAVCLVLRQLRRRNFITVDKPPLSTMVMGLSVRIFGLSSWTILAPEALRGRATVGVLSWP